MGRNERLVAVRDLVREGAGGDSRVRIQRSTRCNEAIRLRGNRRVEFGSGCKGFGDVCVSEIGAGVDRTYR